jgi:hypothetical protein
MEKEIVKKLIISYVTFRKEEKIDTIVYTLFIDMNCKAKSNQH